MPKNHGNERLYSVVIDGKRTTYASPLAAAVHLLEHCTAEELQQLKLFELSRLQRLLPRLDTYEPPTLTNPRKIG